jgi:uncharacterized membrane protein
VDNENEGFKDRSLGLVICGIVEILIGACLALLVPLSLAAVALNPTSMSAGTGLRSAVPAVVLYLVLAGIFVILGVGSIRARRWACDLMLSLSWVWLLTGLCSLVLAVVFLPAMLGATTSSAGLPSGMMQLMMTIIFGVLTVVYVVLPGAFVLFYRSPHVAATCRARDDRPQWTDDCAPPVLSLAVIWALAAVSVLVMPAYRFVMPFFGTLAHGFPGAALWVAVLIVCAALAWGTCRRAPWAWWGGLAATVVAAVSTILTFARISLDQFYRALDLPPDQLSLVLSLPVPGTLAVTLVWVVVWGSFVAYLVSVRKLFGSQPMRDVRTLEVPDGR